MGRYIVRRLLAIVLLLFAVSLITFAIFYILPSGVDPARLRAGKNSTPQQIAAIREQLGLDKSEPEQYWLYVKALVTKFDFGTSYEFNAPVRTLIFDRLPATLSLIAGGVVIWLLVGLSVGIISAVRRGSKLDRFAMTTSLVAVSAPVPVLGLTALLFFASDVGIIHLFPGYGSYKPFSEDPVKWFTSLIMPWCVLAAAFAAIYARLLRGNLVETMSEDYIRTARAKGLSERRVVLRHGVRSAITPVITVLGLDIGTLVGGTILTETVFDIPGFGRLSFDAIQRSDLTVIQGTVLIGALAIVLCVLLVDIAYAFLDPRVRYS